MMNITASMKKFRRMRLRMMAVCFIYLSCFSLIEFFVIRQPRNVLDLIIQIIPTALIIICCIHLSRLYYLTKGGYKYIPQRRFIFFRKPDAYRIKFYRIQRKIACAIWCVLLLILIIRGTIRIDNFLKLALIFGSWIGSTSYIIHQIEYHTEKDDVNLFELEDVGVISSNDIVTALYKDFETWHDVAEGSKLLLLTQDELVVIVFTSASSAQKFCLPLSKIDRLEIMRNTHWLCGDGFSFLFAAGAQANTITVALHGDSYQDSPESFLRKMLHDLDNAQLHKLRPEAEARVRDEHIAPSALRKIDFEVIKLDEASVPKTGNRVIDL